MPTGVYKHKTGKEANSYIDGRCSKVYYCIEPSCSNRISYWNWLYGSKRCRSCADRESRRKFGSPFKGKHLSEKTKKKISLKNKGRKAHNKNIPMKEEQKRKLSLVKGGTGIPYENSNYPEEFNARLKAKIRKRDNYTCQKCNKKFDKYSSYLDIHHIDYDKQNCNEDNLISLCHECNVRANKDRDYWFAYFTYIMEEIK